MRIHADPDPAVFLNAVLDPDPGPGPGPAQPNLKKKKTSRVCLSCKKHKRLLKSKKQWSLCKFTLK